MSWLSRKRAFVWSALVISIVWVGCVAQAPDPLQQSIGDLGFELPELVVSEPQWRAAPDTCDGLAIANELNDSLSIAQAENDPTRAVLMRDDAVLCVDTWNALQPYLENVFGDPAPDPMRPVPLMRELPGEVPSP